MGMGDRKEPFVPVYEAVRDDVLGKRFPPYAVRACPDPAVIKRYATGGVANVSIYVCRKCKHAITFQHHGGVGCGLERELQMRTSGHVGGDSAVNSRYRDNRRRSENLRAGDQDQGEQVSLSDTSW